MQVSNTTICVT